MKISADIFLSKHHVADLIIFHTTKHERIKKCSVLSYKYKSIIILIFERSFV